MNIHPTIKSIYRRYFAEKLLTLDFLSSAAREYLEGVVNGAPFAMSKIRHNVLYHDWNLHYVNRDPYLYAEDLFTCPNAKEAHFKEAVLWGILQNLALGSFTCIYRYADDTFKVDTAKEFYFNFLWEETYAATCSL